MLSTSIEAESTTKLRQGLDILYSFDFENSDSLFFEWVKEDKQDPLPYYLLAKKYLWFYLGCKDEGDYKIFEKYSAIAIEKAEAEIEKNNKDYFSRYIAGEVYGLRAIAKAAKQESMDAFWAAKKSIGYLEDVLELNPKFEDAYLTAGVIRYSLGYLPGFYKLAMRIAGLSPDREAGISGIRLASEKGTIVSAEADFHLSYIEINYFGNYEASYRKIKKVSDKYPENLLFRYQLALIKIKQRKLSEAHIILAGIIKSGNKKFIQTIAYSYFLLGDIYFRKGEYKNAVKHYDEFIERSVELNFLGTAFLRKAISHNFLNEDDQFRKTLSNTSLGESENKEDEYSISKSGHYMKYGITEEEKIVITARNMMESGKYKESADYCIAKIKFIKDNENRAMIYCIAGESFLKLGMLEEALKYLKPAAENIYKREKWMNPYAKIIFAEYWRKRNNKTNMEKYIKAAESDNSYHNKYDIEAAINYLTGKNN